MTRLAGGHQTKRRNLSTGVDFGKSGRLLIDGKNGLRVKKSAFLPPCAPVPYRASLIYGNFAPFPGKIGRLRNSMALDSTDVEKIAHLARLAVSAEETATLQEELSGILGLVERMNALDTADVVPMAHPLEMNQRLRADDVTETDARDSYQEIAPAVEDGLYLVPKVIE